MDRIYNGLMQAGEWYNHSLDEIPCEYLLDMLPTCTPADREQIIDELTARTKLREYGGEL